METIYVICNKDNNKLFACGYSHLHSWTNGLRDETKVWTKRETAQSYLNRNFKNSNERNLNLVVAEINYNIVIV